MDYSGGRLEAKRSVRIWYSYTRERLKHLGKKKKKREDEEKLVVKKEMATRYGN